MAADTGTTENTGEQMNDCQKAFELLHNMPDAQAIGGSDGPRIELRRKIASPGTVSDGTRVFIVKPCERWRWLTVTLGWDTLGQIDQRDYFQRPDAMVQAVLNVIERRAAPYSEQLPAPTLSEALAERGISHEPGKLVGRRRLVGPNGENLGEFDAKGAWAQLNGPGFAEELTPTGLQLVIPGCERVAPDNGKPAQLSLFA